jgi:hypothetical protein
MWLPARPPFMELLKLRRELMQLAELEFLMRNYLYGDISYSFARSFKQQRSISLNLKCFRGGRNECHFFGSSSSLHFLLPFSLKSEMEEEAVERDLVIEQSGRDGNEMKLRFYEPFYW